MTEKEAIAKGYKIVEASPIEFGITKNGQGLRTWWKSSFDHKMPTFSNPLIQEAIAAQEQLEKDFPD